MDCESPSDIETLTPKRERVCDMRRDMDYMRQILADLEASDEWLFHLLPAQSRPLKVDRKREYHIRLLADQGLIRAEGAGTFRMTARGHDFLDHTRDATVWEKTKNAARESGDYSVSLMMDVARGYVRARLREITGIDL